MTEITIKINRKDRKKYGLEDARMSFAELEKKIVLAQAREALERTAMIAKRTGLSKMSNREINQIIKTVRKSA